MIETMVQEKLDEIWDKYGDTVQSLADTEWSERVKPYLQENLIAFCQVNGSWWMTTKEGLDFYPSDFHPTVIKYRLRNNRGFPPILQDDAGQRILGILEALVGGQSLISLANYMPSYDPKGETSHEHE